MKEIIESYFVIGQNARLTHLLKQSFAENWDERYSGQHGHLVIIREKDRLGQLLNQSFAEHTEERYSGQHGNLLFLDTSPEQVIYYAAYSSQPKQNILFSEYLKQTDSQNFQQVLLLVSTYPDCSQVLTESKITDNKHLNLFLEASNGWLVYAHQLEILYRMATGSDAAQAQYFRRNINKKHHQSMEEAKEIKLFGTTLYHVMKERMPGEWVTDAKYGEAYKLFDLLNNGF